MARRKNNISKSKKKNTMNFFDSFGSFGLEKSPEEIIRDIKDSRKLKTRESRF